MVRTWWPRRPDEVMERGPLAKCNASIRYRWPSQRPTAKAWRRLEVLQVTLFETDVRSATNGKGMEAPRSSPAHEAQHLERRERHGKGMEAPRSSPGARQAARG